MSEDFYLCPSCGTDVKVGTTHCPTCGPPKQRRQKKRSRPEKKSWEQDSSLDGIDLPDDDFDYEEFTAREFGEKPPHRKIGIAWYWWLTATLLVIGIIALYMP